MSKHTLGPWRWAEGTVFNDAGPIADCVDSDRDPEIQDANARLIATAPDLLAQLKRAVLLLNGFAKLTIKERKKAYAEFDAVIAKAEGKNED